MASWNDLNICRQMLTASGAMEKRVNVAARVIPQTSCCGQKAVAENVHYGRFAGVDVCERCMTIEEQFLDLLRKLPTEPPPERDEPVRRPAISVAAKGRYAKTSKKIETMLETRAEKEARKARLIREELERLGQGRLF